MPDLRKETVHAEDFSDADAQLFRARASVPKDNRSMTDTPPLRALVIEDDSAHRDAIASVLSESGYEVDIAKDGQEGLDRLESDPKTIDVVVLDLMMPALDGWSLLKIVRNRPHLARIPVVVISAYYDPMHDVGAVRFIAKPFKVEALLRALDDVVTNPKTSSSPPAAK